MVQVISSHDAADHPSPEPFHGYTNQPLNPQASALVSGLERYLLPCLGIRPRSARPPEGSPAPVADPTSAPDPRVQQRLAICEPSCSWPVPAALTWWPCSSPSEQTLIVMVQPSNLWIHEL